MRYLPFSRSLFPSSLILPSIRRIARQKASRTGLLAERRDNSYDSSGGIFYMDAIIVVKGIHFLVLTGAGWSALDVFLNPLSLRLTRFPHRDKRSCERHKWHNHRFVHSRPWKSPFVFFFYHKEVPLRYVIRWKIVSGVLMIILMIYYIIFLLL